MYMYLNFKLLWSGGPNYDTEVLYWFIAALSSIKIVVRVHTYVLKVHIYNINNPIKGLKIDIKVHTNEIDYQNYYYQIYFCVPKYFKLIQILEASWYTVDAVLKSALQLNPRFN